MEKELKNYIKRLIEVKEKTIKSNGEIDNNWFNFLIGYIEAARELFLEKK